MLPGQLRYYFALYYPSAGKLYDFWDKLKTSIETPNRHSVEAKDKSTRLFAVENKNVKKPKSDNIIIAHTETPRLPTKQIFPPKISVRSSSTFDLSVAEASEAKEHSASGNKLFNKKSPSLLSRLGLGMKEKSRSHCDLTVDLPTPPDDELDSASSCSNHITLDKKKKAKWYKKILPSKSSSSPTSSKQSATELLDKLPPVEDGPIGEPDAKKAKAPKKRIKLRDLMGK